MKQHLLILLGICLLSGSFAQAQEAKTFQGDNFEIKVPAVMTIAEKPPTDQAMQALSVGMVDSRGLACQEGMMVQVLPKSNPDRKPAANGKQEFIEQLRRSPVLAEGPFLETINIPGSDGAVLISVRTREAGKQVWRLNLTIHKGQDVYNVNALITAFAGSDLISSKGEGFKEVRDAVLSFRFVAPATKPSTTQPAATRPAG